MDSDFDITLNSSDEASEDSAKGQFLNSLGLGESELIAPLRRDRGTRVQEDEGVVLSSMPDDLGFTAPGMVPDRGVALLSQQLPKERETITAISLPTEDETQPEPEDSSNNESTGSSAAPVDLEETLNLQCPECHGSLVLKRLHLGIEGACVWCHTPIVAAESGRDGQVRVFPILGQAPASAKSANGETGEVPAPTATAAPEPEGVNAAIETPPASASKEAIAAAAPSEIVAEISTVEPNVSFSGFGPLTPLTPSLPTSAPDSPTAFGFGPLPASASETPTLIASANEPDAAISTPDLDSLYETGGFLAAMPSTAAPAASGAAIATMTSPALVEVPVPGFGAPSAEMPVPGFGAFLQNANTPPTAEPAAESASVAAMPEAGPAGEFFTPTPWGPPTPLSKPTSPAAASPAADDAPASLPSGFASGFGQTSSTSQSAPAPAIPAAPTWEAAFGSLKDLPPTPGPVLASDSSTDKGFGEGFLSAGFASAAPATVMDPPAPVARTADTGFSIQPSTAAKVQEEAKSLEETRSFAPPFQAFATGSSSDGEPVAKNLFGEPSPAGSLWGASSSADDAPTSFVPLTPMADLGESTPPVDAEPLFTASEDEPSIAFPSQNPTGATSMFADFRVADPEAPAPAPAEAPAPVGPPALPASATGESPLPATSPTAAPTSLPQVTSQPLGAKPKPKVRKGFIVLMVVIVGFASGAALASFVLPVEQYVNAARAFMEAKFSGGSGVAIPQMPAMPEGLALPTEPPASVDAQP
ncbi:MAG: hypothetical protein JNJ70_24465 [Verrucomicrobiales bacterium]|nr:hypothetical protein [Verrucomicrobiales bacterium]